MLTPNTYPNHEDLTSLSDSFLLMGTVVTIRLVGKTSAHEMRNSIDKAIKAMRTVEEHLSRFDEHSTLRELCRHPGELRSVPPILYHALRVAREVSELTQGLFDPTVGRMLEENGFNRHYLTGEQVFSGIPRVSQANYRDITLMDEGLKVRLEKPMLLDLGAVAKGLAVDLAAKELEGYNGFAIDAGGDAYVFGTDPAGSKWRVGIEDPLHTNRLLTSLELTDMAICTSGSYKRISPLDPHVHHLLNPSTGQSVDGLLSCTAIGPQTILTDVIATAAFLLGEEKALPFIEDMGLAGLLVTSTGQIRETASMREYKP